MDTAIEKSDFVSSANFITDHIHSFLQNMGVSEAWINFVNLLLLAVSTIFIAYFLLKFAKWGAIFIFKKIHKMTGLTFIEYTQNNKLPYYLSLVVPYIFVFNAIPIVLSDYPQLISPCLKMAEIYMVFMVIWTIMSIITSCADLIQTRPGFEGKPIKSYLQIIQILLYLCGLIIIYCILTGSSPTGFFAAMGAASAVLMLMFKDTIMGFVSSIQISTNSLVKIGDWITVSKFGADGNVEEITLTTVKVRNFDNTITTIPTYTLISDSFQNWRGMQESGGRRIKRALIIKQSDIKVMTDDELEVYMSIEGLASYITKKKKEYKALNDKLNLSDKTLLKGFQITNCDLFLCYAVLYLRSNPNIHQGMSLMVRELNPTPTGLPIEIYTFTKTIAAAEYEQVASEIFNHLICRVKDFGLRIFESSSNSDSLTVNLNRIESESK